MCFVDNYTDRIRMCLINDQSWWCIELTAPDKLSVLWTHFKLKLDTMKYLFAFMFRSDYAVHMMSSVLKTLFLNKQVGWYIFAWKFSTRNHYSLLDLMGHKPHLFCSQNILSWDFNWESISHIIYCSIFSYLVVLFSHDKSPKFLLYPYTQFPTVKNKSKNKML